MKHFISYIVLVVCIGIYCLSLSESFTKKIASYKYNSNSLFGSDKYRYGDLFGLSYLPGFQVTFTKEHTVPIDTCESSTRSIDLYALCDSYVWSFFPYDTFYCNVNKFRYVTVNNRENLNVHLDTTKSNILFIEFSERNISDMLLDNFLYLKKFITIQEETTLTGSKENTAVTANNNFLFNKNINTNLEFNLFETAVFTPIKEMKAGLNYRLFNRVEPHVAVSPDSKYLLYFPTIDRTSSESSFRNISDAVIDTIVNRLNEIYFQYKKLGFTEIYFSVIPNPVTILFPHFNGYDYNQLIPRIQDHPKLRMPFMDIYNDFRNAPFPVYMKSDSHWNIDGALIWLNKFNNILRNVRK